MGTNRKKTQLGDDSWIQYFRVPVEIQATDTEFQYLLSLKPKERGKVKVYGKVYDVPRWQKSFGRAYYFSGMMHDAGMVERESYLEKLLHWVQRDSGFPYNQILINWYMDGTEHIGAHSDDTTQLVPQSKIYSFSFGAIRDFIIKSKHDPNKSFTLALQNNSCVIMGGFMQNHFRHEVPKRLTVKEPRVNVTFRLYKEDIN
jgi:alkylated DNA repair dioxygenase AlkB